MYTIILYFGRAAIWNHNHQFYTPSVWLLKVLYFPPEPVGGMFYESRAANRPRSKWFISSKRLLLPSTPPLVYAAAKSPLIFTLWAQRLHLSRCTEACWQEARFCWSAVCGEKWGIECRQWNLLTLVWLFLSFAEVEAQRSGSAAHCQRPVSGQPYSSRTPNHCSVSPPGARTVLGATDYQLI